MSRSAYQPYDAVAMKMLLAVGIPSGRPSLGHRLVAALGMDELVKTLSVFVDILGHHANSYFERWL